MKVCPECEGAGTLPDKTPDGERICPKCKGKTVLLPKITLKLVRSFGLGFTIFSPKLNGLAFDVALGCFHCTCWGKGNVWVGVSNHWNG